MTGSAAQVSNGLGFELPPPPKVNFSRYGEIELQPLSKIQKVSGSYLHRNWVSIPHVTQNDLADITELEAYRKANAGKAQEKGFKLTPLVFLIKASVAALKQFPFFNASLDGSGENLVMKKYFHIGIAVDTPNGLVVPVIRDCDQKDIYELAAELSDLSQRAREGKLEPVEMQGGCFSISSLGGIGGTAFTPIINAPEVAILGVSRSSTQAVWDGGTFQPRVLLPLCLSYDHRVIDGANGARFTRYLAGCLEDFENMEL
jgi:pyruvate dehydrogenase E2 component (dihydrolipoamide acetyltransferase)